MNISLSDHFGYRKLIRFSLPTIIMMIFTSIYGVIDGLFISNVVGSEAFAAVNLIMPVPMILGSVGFMIGTGGSALVSKTLGEQRHQKANEYFSMLVYLLVVSGVVLAAVGIPFLRQLAGVLGATEDMLSDCVTYATIVLIALPAFMLQNSFQSFLVVAEKPGMGLRISILSGITNMVLDFLFVYVLRLGVAGAAWATAFSQVVGAVIPVLYFARENDSPLRLVRAKWNWSMIRKACLNGSSEMVTNISMSLISMLYNWQLMRLAGQSGVVAYGIIMYVGFLFVGTYLGYSVGTAPIIGYHYGAGNHGELRSLLRKSMTLLTAAAVIMAGIAELTAGLQARIFVGYDPELLKFTVNAIRLYSLSYFISEINIFTSSFFTALNNGAVSALISFLRTFAFLVVAVIAAPVVLGINGIWLAVVFAEGLSLIVCLICLKTNQKKYQY